MCPPIIRRLCLILVVAGSAFLASCAPSAPSQPPPAAPAPSPLHAVTFYLPNRLVDLLDVVSAGVGIPSIPYLLPASVHANAHVTRACQAGLGSTHGLFLGKGEGRCLAWKFVHHELSVGPLTVTEMEHTAHTAARVERVGVLSPSDEPFATGHLDYWAVGAHVGLLPVALSVDVHPVELADALAGFLFLDPLGDDTLRPRPAPPPPPPSQ